MKAVLLVLLIGVLAYYAVIGVACLYFTTPIVNTAEECDKTMREGKTLWCMTIVKEES